jgi:putative component of membrane protein insertase Oxa1/YidC/SpoIIIJ protein YidD
MEKKMKLSPKKDAKTKKYPTVKEYKNKFVITTFTIGMALTPAMITSCNSKPTHTGGIVPIKQEVKQEKKGTQNIEPTQKHVEKTTKTLGEPPIQKPEQLEGEMKAPLHNDKDTPPCDTTNKDIKKPEKVMGQEAIKNPKEIEEPKAKMGEIKSTPKEIEEPKVKMGKVKAQDIKPLQKEKKENK